MAQKNLKTEDSKIYEIIEKEKLRQTEGLELIPSESYASRAVLEAVGSVLNNKYAENYPGKRYYGGCVNVDELELLCQKRAREVFKAEGYHVNVQPYSGSPANLEVYFGLLEPGDTIMALRLDHGGHLTHGRDINLSGRLFKFVHYQLDEKTEMLDYDAIQKLAEEHKPKLIVSGYTAYPRIIDFKKFHEIAKGVGAYSMADISHISGLVLSGEHPSPFPFTDIVTTTTHKTLRGPRGAMIFCKEEFKEKIDRAVFPGMQGGPHENSVAGIAVALHEATLPAFKEYAHETVRNAKALAAALQAEGLRLISGGTDNHLIMIDLRPFGPGRGIFIEKALEQANISVNKQPIPNDPAPPYYPSGIRLGTPCITSRGMREEHMKIVAAFIAKIVHEFAKNPLPDEKEKRIEALKAFNATLPDHPLIKEVRAGVKAFAGPFPVPGIE